MDTAMQLLKNPFRGPGLAPGAKLAHGTVSRDPSEPLALLQRCPAAAVTPLQDVPELAAALRVGALRLKNESSRMGLGSFKALGAAYAIARLAARSAERLGIEDGQQAMRGILADEVFVCASAGNHGLSVAAGARIFGARAVIYLGTAVPEPFAERLRRAGAEVVREGDDYAASMQAAARDARTNGWTLLSDSSWPGYTEWPTRVMEGYLVAADEVCRQSPRPPTHIFLQAGVGGFAAAMTALFRDRWGDAPVIVVVEPEAAPALIESVRAGRPVEVAGPVSNMGRLDCKEPSHLALAELAREADYFATLSDEACAASVAFLERFGIATTPSGAAGFGALQQADAHRDALGLHEESEVLAFITEGPEVST
jgi:diaminopropionate ammonia-lyase